MPNIASQDLNDMRDSVFFEGPESGRRLSRFWMLMILSAVIAGAGVVADSTATVIGAMIVAPLMTPIQGTMLAAVLGDRKNLLRSVGLVIAGALAAIAIGWLLGAITAAPVVAQTNSQVASRVNPTLIDLLAALATGAVGSIALVRRDISDTLPGVAIAISLVPPLAVVGLTLQAHEWSQAGGALLLFGTNVAAILGVGTIIMAIYGVHRMSPQYGCTELRSHNRRNAVFAIATLAIIVVVPLTDASLTIAHRTEEESSVTSASETWVKGTGWVLVSVATESTGITVARFEGPPPTPATAGLRAELIRRGVAPADVQAEFVPKVTVDLGAPPGP